jgi:hypothetical protein
MIMTTMTPKRKTARKPLRIRPELLPDSAKYATFDDEEYVMIPVRDFGDWFEDIEDMLSIEDARNNPAPGISLEELVKKAHRPRKGKK